MSKKQPPHIILVEDDKVLSSLIQKKLEKHTYRVTVARDGETGLALIRKESPDLVLLDMNLPKRSGFDILETLYKDHILPKLPVVIISNSGQPVEVNRALELGIKDYLIKLNFDPKDVLAKVDQFCHIKKTSQEKQTISAKERKTQALKHTGKQTQDNSKSARRHILVVEDDVFLADLLGRKLKNNFKTHYATNATQAKTMLKNYPIDIICLDIVLPGMDGITFLKNLKDDVTFKDIPVLIISNLGQREEIQKGLDAGAVDYIVKANSSPSEILKHIEKILQKNYNKQKFKKLNIISG